MPYNLGDWSRRESIRNWFLCYKISPCGMMKKFSKGTLGSLQASVKPPQQKTFARFPASHPSHSLAWDWFLHHRSRVLVHTHTQELSTLLLMHSCSAEMSNRSNKNMTEACPHLILFPDLTDVTRFFFCPVLPEKPKSLVRSCFPLPQHHLLSNLLINIQLLWEERLFSFVACRHFYQLLRLLRITSFLGSHIKVL